MKKIHIIFMLLFFFMGVANISIAQKKSKEEIALEKEWAAKLKALKPLDYKKMMEEKDALSTQITECENTKSVLRTESENSKSELDSKSIEIAKLKKEIEDLNSAATTTVKPDRTTITTATTSTTTVKKTGTTVTTNKAPIVAGVIFKVQIGSFKTRDLTKYFDNNPNFSGEVDADGSKKYTLGLFTDYWEADKFKKALREMGVKGAWVVPYKDGQRVNLKDVLEGAL
jgi:hypothetical protein